MLRENEELYRDLIEHSEDLIGIHDMDGVILSINPAAVRQLGYESSNELIGRNFAEFIAPDAKNRFRRYLDSLSKGATSGLLKVLTRKGEERIWEFHNSVRTEGVEKPVIRAMAHDITERVRSEQALRETEQLRSALYRIAECASSSSDLQKLYEEIYACISGLISAPNFYIALYDKRTETVTFPYHVDNFDPDWEPKVKRRGLTEYVIRTGKPMLVTPEVFAELLQSGEVEVVISKRIDWMGVPLQAKGETFGMLGVHSYSGDVRFGPKDLDILTFVSRQIASAIERKQAQEDLIRAEERFRQVVEFAPNAMMMIDTDGRIALVNSMAERLFGYTREELLQMRVEELMPAQHRSGHVQERHNFTERGQPRPMGAHRELVILRKDGTEVPAEIGLNPMRSREGTYILAAIVDITERRKAEKALAEQEEKYRLLAQRIPAITYIAELGEPGTWLFVSSRIEKELGYSPAEWMNDPGLYWRQMHPEDRERIKALEDRSRAGRTAFTAEYRLISKNGETVWFHDEATVLENEVFQGFLINITERKKAEKLKDEMSSVVAHELKAPLTSILGSLSYLQSRGSLQDRELQLVEMAEKNSQRMLRLINDLLEIDKIESGRVVLDLKRQHLMPLIDQAVEINQPYAVQYGVQMAVVESAPHAVVLVDPDRVVQVMTNLLTNAAKFSPEGGSVEIRIRAAGGKVKVSVTDHGPGIPDSFLNSIFQRFAQAETDRKKKGSGLGLNISKALIERMSGKIGFETVPGSGTTFYFELPLSPPAHA